MTPPHETRGDSLGGCWCSQSAQPEDYRAMTREIKSGAIFVKKDVCCVEGEHTWTILGSFVYLPSQITWLSFILLLSIRLLYYSLMFPFLIFFTPFQVGKMRLREGNADETSFRLWKERDDNGEFNWHTPSNFYWSYAPVSILRDYMIVNKVLSGYDKKPASPTTTVVIITLYMNQELSFLYL